MTAQEAAVRLPEAVTQVRRTDLRKVHATCVRRRLHRLRLLSAGSVRKTLPLQMHELSSEQCPLGNNRRVVRISLGVSPTPEAPCGVIVYP